MQPSADLPLKPQIPQLNAVALIVMELLHKNLYHTLFESHLSYEITVWGGISISKLKSVSTAQKHCIRIMFGDNEAYLEKHRTAARTRDIDTQKLGPEFLKKSTPSRYLITTKF